MFGTGVTAKKWPQLSDDSGAKKSTKESGKTPSKPRAKLRRWLCPYCGNCRTRLPRHLLLAHKDEERVKQMQQNPHEARNIVRLIRNEGMHQYNSKKTKEEEMMKTSIRGGEEKLGTCSTCKAIIKRGSMRHHRKTCREAEIIPYTEELVTDNVTIKEDLKKILLGLKDGKEKQAILRDHDLQFVITRIYAKKTKCEAKERSVLQAVRAEARLLAILWLSLEDELKKNHKTKEPITFFHMFQIKFKDIPTIPLLFKIIEEKFCYQNSQRLNLQNCMKHATNILLSKYAAIGDYEAASSINLFATSWKEFSEPIFKKTLNYIIYERRPDLRDPSNLPRIEDMNRLKNYIIEKINVFDKSDISTSNYIDHRDLINVRLTMFNGRRSNECGNLKIKNWIDACEDRYLHLHPNKAMLIKKYYKKYKLTYTYGKGSKQVPVLIPDDCWNILHWLSNKEIRNNVNISSSNNYIFASLKHSKYQSSGTAAMKKISSNAGVSITAKDIRHLMATKFGGLSLKSLEKEAIMDHMSHDEKINKNIYQAPRAIQEMTITAKAMHEFERGFDGNKGESSDDSSISHIKKKTRIRSDSSPDSDTVEPRPRSKRKVKQRIPQLLSSEEVDETPSEDFDSDSSEFVPEKVHLSLLSEKESDNTDSELENTRKRTVKKKVSSLRRGRRNDTGSEPETVKKQTFKKKVSSLRRERKDNTDSESESVKKRTLKKKVSSFGREKKSYSWSIEETTIITKYFKDYIKVQSLESLKGPLPGQKELMEFREKYPNVGKDMEVKQYYTKLRTKIFNTRWLKQKKIIKLKAGYLEELPIAETFS